MKKALFLSLFCISAVCTLLIFAFSACDSSEAPPIDTDTEIAAPKNGEAMLPTEADMLGMWDNMLIIPIENNRYRYSRTELDPSNYTKDDILYSYSNELDFSAISVYSLDGHDLTMVYVLVLDNHGTYEYIYEYAPPQACAPDELEKAKQNGYVVLEDGAPTYGQEKWYDFYNTTSKGIASEIKLAKYYTLDKDHTGKELYESTKEDYPRIFYITVTYDRDHYIVTSEDKTARKYLYLHKFTDVLGEYTSYPGRTYERYVLTNIEDVTWDQISFGMFSSQFGDYIDHYSLYTEKVKE